MRPPEVPASVRVPAFSFERMDVTWNLTVWSEMPSLCAMSLLLAPSASSRSTSISRGVSETEGGGGPDSESDAASPRVQELKVELSMRTADAAVDSNSAADPARLEVPTTSKRSDSERAAARPARTMGDSPITNTRILSSKAFKAPLFMRLVRPYVDSRNYRCHSLTVAVQ